MKMKIVSLLAVSVATVYAGHRAVAPVKASLLPRIPVRPPRSTRALPGSTAIRVPDQIRPPAPLRRSECASRIHD